MAASRAEEDLEWLSTHQLRLATLVARQDLHELLPEGRGLHRSGFARCCRKTCSCKPLTLVIMWCASGDYSDSQLLRVHRQAIVLNKFYDLLTQAITSFQACGQYYKVHDIAALAGQALGKEAVGGSTVRIWHAQYVESKVGMLRPDERGHYTRELLITEEDVKQKFVQWSLRAAKADDLSVELARDFLNNELLNTLEACTRRPQHTSCGPA